MLEKLKQAALNEDWDYVDQHISEVVDDEESLLWASKELSLRDSADLCDLAATLLAETSSLATDEVLDSLQKVLETDGDDWVFARFRSACALVKHGLRSVEVIDILLEFTRHDETDLRPIANRYLSLLTNDDIKHYCEEYSYDIEQGFDKPGFEYEQHFHERTVLKTIDGSITVTIDVGEIELTKGDFILVHEKENHTATVGPDGWRWQAMYSPNESKEYPGRH